MKIHDDAPVLVIDVHIWRRDVRRRDLGEQIVRDGDTPSGPCRAQLLQRFGRHRGWLRQEGRIGDLQAAGLMDMPWTQHVVGIGQPDVSSLVIGKVKIVGPQTILDPVRDANQRRTLDVLPDARMQIGRDDRHVQQSLDAHAGGGRLGLEPALDREPDDPADKRDGPASSGHIHESGN